MADDDRAALGLAPTLVSDSSPSSDDRPLAVGQRVDRYEITGTLGAGGMGIVYAARDTELGREVALKLVRARGEGMGEAHARLRREARVMAQLSHPNIAVIHDIGELDDRLFIAMERLDGGTLRQWLATKPRWREVVAMFVQAGRGLAAAHAAGVIHRDFKPDNVLLGSGGQVRVADFGLARPLGADDAPAGVAAAVAVEDASTITRTDGVVGTIAYMAPEQLLGRPIDARADQFAFCVALYEALEGVRPFGIDGALPTVAAHALAVTAARSRPWSSREVPARVRRAIERGLRPDPAQRWPSIDALLIALASARRTRWLPVALGTSVASGAGIVALLVTNTSPTAHEPQRATPAIGDAAVDANPTTIVWGPVAGLRSSTARAPNGDWYFLEGTRLMRVAADRTVAPFPGVGPVARLNDGPGGPVVFVVDRGRTESLTTKEVYADVMPNEVVSVDGTLRATPELEIIRRSDGHVIAKVTKEPGEYFSFIKWSPDSRRLAYIRQQMTGGAGRAEVLELDSPARPIELAEQTPAPRRSIESLVWRDAHRIVVGGFGPMASGKRALDVLEWQLRPDGAPIARLLLSLPPGETRELVGIVSGALIYLEHASRAGAVMSRRGTDGHWLPPTALQHEGAVAFSGWTRDGELLWARKNPKVGGVEMMHGEPGGVGSVVRPEDPGSFAVPLAMLGDNVIHYRPDGLYVLDGNGRLRKLPLARDAAIACGGDRCVATENRGRRTALRELDLDAGLGATILEVDMPNTGSPPPAVSDDGDLVALSAGTTVHVHSRSRKKLEKRELQHYIQALAFDGTKGKLVGTTFGPFGLVEIDEHDNAHIITSGPTYYHAPDVSADGKRLFVATTEMLATLVTTPLPD